MTTKTKLPHRVTQELEPLVTLLNEGLKEYGAPDDLGVLFDGEEATFHKYEILQSSENQWALGFVAAIALVKGVAPETLLTPPKKKKAPPKKRAPKKGQRKTAGPDATVIHLHRGGRP
jgi:hypothetical protein